MTKFNLKCKKCGDRFEPTKEEREMYEDGDAILPAICDDCFSLQESAQDEYYQFSDADNGL